MYVTTGNGTVQDRENEKEYPLIEQCIERQSGRDIFMASIDHGVGIFPIACSERVATVAPQPPAAEK